MLNYVVIPLSNASISFCHYDCEVNQAISFISEHILHQAIIWAKKNNLFVQFVYPSERVPYELTYIIESVDHIKIVPHNSKDDSILSSAEVIIFNLPSDLYRFNFSRGKTYILRSRLDDLISNKEMIIQSISEIDRLNFVLTDIPNLQESHFIKYQAFLYELSDSIFNEYQNGHFFEVNVLTDRIFLKTMNNCGAGKECVSIDLNGNFFLCPAFHNMNATMGSITSECRINNPHLFSLEKSPVCRICDAWQCKRCIWLNHIQTEEYNIPGHEQCVISHIERSVSKDLLSKLMNLNPDLFASYTINPIDYLDPFDLIH